MTGSNHGSWSPRLPPPPAGADLAAVDSETSWRISALRFPLIFLVVLIHANDTELHVAGTSTTLELPLPVRWTIELIANQLARIAVPFFFVFSSYLLGTHLRRAPLTWLPEMKKRLWRLVPPYLCWNILYSLFYWLGWRLPFSHPYFSGGTLKFESVGIRFILAECFGFNQYPADVALWYLRNLIIFFLFSYPALVCLRRMSRAVMFGTATLIVLLLLVIPLGFRELIVGIHWFLLGFWFGLHGESVDLEGWRRGVITVVWTLLCFGGATLSVTYPEFSKGLLMANIFELVFIPTGLWVVWSWCAELKKFPNVLKQLHRLAPTTFVIFAAHGIVLASVRKLVWKALAAQEWPFLMVALYVFCPIFSVAVCLVAHASIQRLPPALQMWFDNPSTGAKRPVRNGLASTNPG